MSARQLNADLLINKRVRALNGRVIGHIEDIRLELRDGQCFVGEYLIGVFALFQRLAAGRIGRAILGVLGLRTESGGYRVPWHELDMSDPERPRLRCALDRLAPIKAGE